MQRSEVNRGLPALGRGLRPGHLGLSAGDAVFLIDPHHDRSRRILGARHQMIGRDDYQVPDMHEMRGAPLTQMTPLPRSASIA